METPVASPTPVPPDTPYDALKTEIDGYISYSRLWMRVWAVVYYLLRTALIVVSALVAAKADLFSKDDTHTIAVLSLLVAVGTALDTWLKTGTRYKGHYTFNDKFIGLYTYLELSNHTDLTSLEKIRDQFIKLIDDYAVAVLPS